ncbi:hypothetical protein [Lactococcus ileimucosae]|uniref:hypothetical protein n=1 Tax=Lactococcus ileimucosae TaxID=2941329 RepID=UPI0035150F0C
MFQKEEKIYFYGKIVPDIKGLPKKYFEKLGNAENENDSDNTGKSGSKKTT